MRKDISKKPLIVDHPLVQQALTALRNRKTSSEEFRRHAHLIAKVLVIEATSTLKSVPCKVATPLAPHRGSRVKAELVIIPVLRAGLAMLFATQDLLPSALIGFIGLRRDEKTAEAHRYYQNIPDSFLDHKILVFDPMLATGGSLDETITSLKTRGAKDISVVCMVAAPEGVARISQRHPEVQIITAAIDKKLNAKKFIVPGLGDFGDRYFNT